ncbi:hypothetical protein CSC94_02485 [Zhengella mangrovi]|uniref:Oxidoreductase n=1 Tax=Zhengella mangrovi TaxID=1982044 RepID=A0A2G1QUK7_9HYPH|nr:DUF934 domain-containing protein [Zhengella mangrovi]PHP68878.1 hypothetical protein CSC94_02485 [Zhengella mangrovi]
MADTNDNTAPRLWTRAGGFVEDTWIRAGGIEDRERGENLVLPLDGFLALDEEERTARAGYLAVEIQPGESLEPLLPFLGALPLIVLAFPAFNDGRSYSKATLLRSRYGFAGAVRASGDVLPDQVAHMLRTGFDELEVSHGVAIARLQAGAVDAFAAHYQPAVDAAGPAARFAWRRVPA